MTFQFLEQISIIATSITVFGGIVLVILNKAKKSFKKKETTPEEILQYIEDLDKKIDDFKKEIIKEFDDEKKHASDTHLRIFKKLEDLSEGLAFIKGYLKA